MSPLSPQATALASAPDVESFDLEPAEPLPATFSERELHLIQNCQDYEASQMGGLPGHALIRLVAKLTQIIEADSESVAAYFEPTLG